MGKEEFIRQLVSDMMYEDEYLEYYEAVEIATAKWEDLRESKCG